MSLRKQNFRDAFRPEEFRAFRAAYEGINPDRPLETSGIAFGDTEPLFRDFLRTSDTSAAFVEEFLPHLGMFLQGPFPLPGNRVLPSGRTHQHQNPRESVRRLILRFPVLAQLHFAHCDHVTRCGE